MRSNQKNWTNCSMFVQDINLPGVNITAELTEEEVDSFKQICKMFIPFSLHDKNIDEYFSKMSQAPPASAIHPVVNTKSGPPMRNVPPGISKPPTPIQRSSDTHAGRDLNSNIIPKSKPSAVNIGTPSSSTTPKITTSPIDSLNINEIAVSIRTTAIDIIFRTMKRISHEMDIIGLLTRHLKSFDSKLELTPFGSSTYGFGGFCTDYNVLVSTGTKKQMSIDLNLFEFCTKSKSIY